MNISRKFFALPFIILSFTLVGCVENPDRAESIKVDDQQEHYANVQPLGFYDYSLPRYYKKQIDDFRILHSGTTYSVVTADGTGVPIYACPSKGFPIPADTSFTNPLQPVYSNGAVIEQAEPDGLFPSKNTNATYVLCIRKNGDVVPVYSEPKVLSFPFAVEIIDGKIVEIEDSPSLFKINTDVPTPSPTTDSK